MRRVATKFRKLVLAFWQLSLYLEVTSVTIDFRLQDGTDGMLLADQWTFLIEYIMIEVALYQVAVRNSRNDSMKTHEDS